MQYTADTQYSCTVHVLEVWRGNGTTVRMVGVMQYRISRAESLHTSWPQLALHFMTGIQMSSLMNCL